MYHKTIYHTLPERISVKFTICDREIDNETFYYANVINTDLDFYVKKTDIEKEMYYGMEVTDGKKKSINYKDPMELEADLLEKYGEEWLESEK